ncbi:aminopeptidase N, partial [Biomphalaria glabrata]
MSAKKLMDFSKSHPDFTALNTRSEFHISGLAGFVFLMLVTAIVSVGIIVHFAVGKSETVCRCEPGTTLKGQTSECSKLASQGNKELCEKCPAPTSTHIRRSATQKSTPCSGYNASQEPISNDTSTEKPKLTNYRLPTALYPLHYNVELQPYMTDPYPANFTFKGKVKIWMRCDQPSNNVTLHILSLEVDNTSLRFYGDFPGYTGPYYLTLSGDKDREFFILNLDGYTEVGKTYVIEMSYTSPLKDDLLGLYYSTYTRNGQTVYMVATQFQGTFARKAFPCFDEPAMKATFNITLVRPSHLISLSNMPIINNSTT